MDLSPYWKCYRTSAELLQSISGGEHQRWSIQFLSSPATEQAAVTPGFNVLMASITMKFTMIACYQAYNSTVTEHALDDVICIAVSIGGRSKALLQSMPQHCWM